MELDAGSFYGGVVLRLPGPGGRSRSDHPLRIPSEIGVEENRSRNWFGGASGYPILTPAVDLVEIGTGGGSIAYADSGGRLRVGPRSAGANPGPACYGVQDEQPTITDANLLLGRLNPDYFLGGEMRLDVDAVPAQHRVGGVEAGLCPLSDAA